MYFLNDDIHKESLNKNELRRFSTRYIQYTITHTIESFKILWKYPKHTSK
jgi:hypothetical protein